MLKIFKPFFNFLIKNPANLFGYEINLEIKSNEYNSEDNDGSLNLNIGAGSYLIDGFKSLDILTDYFYPDKKEFYNNRIEYDIRKDKIPYSDNSVDNIYISHVIEHIETKFVKNFIEEAFRVLKPGGVLRIVTVDARFLFEVSQFDNDFWHWRIDNLKDQQTYETDWDKLERFDFLIKETAKPRFRFYKNKVEDKVLDINKIKNLNFEEFRSLAMQNLDFREDYPNDHISIWDFDSLNKLGLLVGFKNILLSKYLGSVSLKMQGSHFDKTSPKMSIYVEMIK